MSSEPQKLHPAAIAVLALGALRDAALPIIVLLFTAVAGSGLDTGALERGAALPRARRRGRLARGLHALAQHELQRSTSAACTGRAGSCARSRRRCRSTASRASTPWPGRSSACSASSRCTCRPRAAAPRARSCSRRSARRRSSGCARRCARRRPEVAEAAPADRDLPERRLSRRDGLIAALTAGQLGVILPVLAVAFQLFTNIFQDERGVEDASRLAPDTLGGWELALGALLLAAWALSVAGSLVAFAGFTVTRDGDRLRIRRGLLQRTEAALPVRRVHAVRVVEGVLRRPFGLATLRVEVAGYAEEAAAARTLFPLLRRAEVEPFLAELLPELADDPIDLDAAARARGAPLRAAADAWPALVVGGARLPALPRRRAVAAAAGAAARARRLARLPRRGLAAARRPAGDALAAARVVDAADARRAAAAARDRAEPAAAPRRPRRPRGGGRQGRPRAASATSSCRSRPSCGSVCGDDATRSTSTRLALRLPHRSRGSRSTTWSGSRSRSAAC